MAALTKDEIIICAALGHDDRSLAALFEEVAASLPEDRRTALAEDQRRWVVQRNAACGVSNDTDLKPAIWRRLVECFREQYRTRGDYLRTAQGGQSASPPALPPSKVQNVPEFETVWRAAAGDPQRAMEKLRTHPNAQARLYADILEHALSSESDVEFTKFAEGVLWVTGSGDGDSVYISCSLIQKFPRLLELTRGFHGGNRDNFTPRADCDVDEAGLPASVDQLLDRLDLSIRNHVTGFACGSSRYHSFKEVRVADIRMAFVPQTYLGPARPTGHWIAAEWTPLTAIPLERWSNASLPNHLAFEQDQPGFLQALADLATHYEQVFGMKAKRH